MFNVWNLMCCYINLIINHKEQTEQSYINWLKSGLGLGPRGSQCFQVQVIFLWSVVFPPSLPPSLITRIWHPALDQTLSPMDFSQSTALNRFTFYLKNQLKLPWKCYCYFETEVEERCSSTVNIYTNWLCWIINKYNEILLLMFFLLWRMFDVW